MDTNTKKKMRLVSKNWKCHLHEFLNLIPVLTDLTVNLINKVTVPFDELSVRYLVHTELQNVSKAVLLKGINTINFGKQISKQNLQYILLHSKARSLAFQENSLTSCGLHFDILTPIELMNIKNLEVSLKYD